MVRHGPRLGTARRERDLREGTTWDPGLPLLAGRGSATTTTRPTTIHLSNGVLR
ncbi:hypothetical protein GCM10009798_19490 [Nocardioides panacihumi]|uniref:Uncharacterized protein n=1 Tax=Nocardioides panacihumi TaxID=400774 RepID=A0ABN2QXV3_9ACTN